MLRARGVRDVRDVREVCDVRERSGRGLRLLPIVALCFLAIAGCSARGPAPVAERSVADAPASGMHRVRAGETLYSIAWRYGLDWQALARRNGIGAPWLIRPGEALRVSGTGPAIARAAPTRPAADRSAASGRSATAPAAGAPTVRPAPGSQPVRDRAVTSSRAEQSVRTAQLRWIWPMDGELLQGFDASGSAPNKGIDIRGADGAPIRVAAPGEVVYAGGGLRGHRQLVIVKHDANWLSAYAHNGAGSRVREGQRLAAGDTVASVGGAPHQRILHFEIRRDGKPVDPAGVLPGR